MQYITAVSKSSADVDRVKRQLLESNPLLEGTSSTLVSSIFMIYY